MSHAQTESIAWRPEADPVSGLNFTNYRKSLIHETQDIKDLLSESDGERFIISAPKGFGKTLLLIAKSKQLAEHRRYSTPTASRTGLIDGPRGRFPELSRERIESLSGYSLMKDIWSLAIMVAAVKYESHDSGRDVSAVDCDDWIKGRLSADTKTYSASQIFAALISESTKVMYRVLGSQQALNTYFDDIQTPMVFFIDNVDEYFEPVLEVTANQASPTQSSSHRNKSNALWTIAQLGLVGAAHRFHQANSNVQVYCTVRQEALRHLGDHTALQTQILGRTVEIRYDYSDFEEIFKKNVRLMSSEKLHHSPDQDPMEAFFGPSALMMKHRFVDQDEAAFDYTLRHTFYRPRDLVVLGRHLAALEPKARTEMRIQEVIDDHCESLVSTLYKEMQPFFCLPDRRTLFSLLKQNVLTMDDLRFVTQRYKNKMKLGDHDGDDAEHECAHPFCVLQRIGMLGWVHTEFQRELSFTQKFVQPREIQINGPVGLEQTEKHYLIHPALDKLILKASGSEFTRRYHSLNIIGNEKPWTPPHTSLFVVKGDIEGFSTLMGTEHYEGLVRRLHEGAASACAKLHFYEVSQGDSIVMIDASARRLIEAAAEMVQRFAANPDQTAKLRFGGSAGPIQFQDAEKAISGGRQTSLIPSGMALRTSARLEPYSTPGSLLFDSLFKDMAKDQLTGLRPQELRSVDLPSVRCADDEDGFAFLIQKSPDDPPYRTRLYKISLL